MRSLAPAAQALLGKELAMALLVEMRFGSGTIYVTDAGVDIDWNGQTWLGLRGAAVEDIKDQGGEVQGLSFSLSGIPPGVLALALGEEAQGRIVICRCALMEPDAQAIVDVQTLWTGTMDRMPIRHGGEALQVSVTAEHRGIAFARPKGRYYTDADQQSLYPGDLALQYLAAQAATQDVWPSRNFFKR